MPIKLLNQEQGVIELFEFFDVVNDTDKAEFVLRNSSDERIYITYPAKVNTEWKYTDFEVYLFRNTYLNAESNIFEVRLDDINERMGYIFPIQVLESNELDSEFSLLNNYKSVALIHLLNRENPNIGKLKVDNDLYSITELFDENIIICILNNKSTSQIAGYSFDDYLFSLYKCGYHIFKPQTYPLFISNFKNNILSSLRTKRKLKFKKSGFNITSSIYIKNLFEDTLIGTDNYIVRFVLLYQILEYLMELEFNTKFQSVLNDYLADTISKNDLKEKLNEVSKEKKLLFAIFHKCSIEISVQSDFIAECDTLFNLIPYASDKIFPQILYEFRNLMTHRYRDLSLFQANLQTIIEQFEMVIIDVLIGYN